MFSLFPFLYGFQTEFAYAICGRTGALFRKQLMFFASIWMKLRLIIPNRSESAIH